MKHAAHNQVRIFGIDPGSRVAGFACLAARKPVPLMPQDYKVIDLGVLKVDPKRSHFERIGLLHVALYELLKELSPTVCVVEKEFAGLNPMTSLKLGEARGALLAAVHRNEIPLIEVTPAQVKRAIAGSGRATKEDVHQALKKLLLFDRTSLPLDATDALALALYHGLALPFLRKT